MFECWLWNFNIVLSISGLIPWFWHLQLSCLCIFKLCVYPLFVGTSVVAGCGHFDFSCFRHFILRTVQKQSAIAKIENRKFPKRQNKYKITWNLNQYSVCKIIWGYIVLVCHLQLFYDYPVVYLVCRYDYVKLLNDYPIMFCVSY